MAPRSPLLRPSAMRPQARPVPPYAQNPVYHQQPVAPIHLSGAVQLQTGTAGGIAPAALKNPMGQDMEILEVKFEVSGSLGQNADVGVPYGGSIGCELALGSYKLTNGAVPVWNFGRAENRPGEAKIETIGFASTPYSYCSYSWRLPRPLFIPAGAALVPNFNHFGYVPFTLGVRIGYSARSVFKRPKTIYLPWVASYKSKVFNPITDASTDASDEEELINDTDRVIKLQRFTGRLQYIFPDGTTSDIDPVSVGARYLTMRMVDSYGRPIVRTYTPFHSVFSPLTRSWELEDIGAQLDPGAFYRVFLKKAAMTMASGQNGGQVQAFVSMVGWREEPV